MHQDQDMIGSQVIELYFIDPYFDQSNLSEYYLSHIDYIMILLDNNFLILIVFHTRFILLSISFTINYIIFAVPNHRVAPLHHRSVKILIELLFILYEHEDNAEPAGLRLQRPDLHIQAYSFYKYDACFYSDFSVHVCL